MTFSKANSWGIYIPVTWFVEADGFGDVGAIYEAQVVIQTPSWTRRILHFPHPHDEDVRNHILS